MATESLEPGCERRRAPRYSVVLEGDVQLTTAQVADGAVCAQAKTENLSRNGLCILVDRLDPQQAQAVLKGCHKCSGTFQLPGSSAPLLLSGEVVWINIIGDESEPSARLGLQLTDTALEERERLSNFLARLAARADDKPE